MTEEEKSCGIDIEFHVEVGKIPFSEIITHIVVSILLVFNNIAIILAENSGIIASYIVLRMTIKGVFNLGGKMLKSMRVR